MRPTPVHPPPPPPVHGSALTRGLRAVFVEHRLPHAADRLLDAALSAVGLRCTTVRVGGLRLWVRRTGTDRDVIRNVLAGREYVWPGYEVGPADVVIDVGGNIGAFAVPAAKAAVGGRVIAVEPDADNHRLLAANLRRNGCANAVVVPVAVAGHAGRVRLVTDADASGHRIGAADGPGVWVEAVTLADLFDAHRVERCDLLKLDCEGAEFDILATLPTAAFARVRRIAMEYHAAGPAKADRAGELVRRLESHGFRIDRYTDVAGEPVGHVFATNRG